MVFDIAKGSQSMSDDPTPTDVVEKWRKTLLDEGRAAKATEGSKKALQSAELQVLARKVFDEISALAKHRRDDLHQTFIVQQFIHKRNFFRNDLIKDNAPGCRFDQFTIHTHFNPCM